MTYQQMKRCLMLKKREREKSKLRLLPLPNKMATTKTICLLLVGMEMVQPPWKIIWSSCNKQIIETLYI